jgi:hypothetical protein
MRQVFYTILFEFGINMKLNTLIKMSLNESHSEFRAGKYLYDAFPINNCFKYAIWKVRVKGKVVPVLNEAPRHEGVMGKWMYSSTHS